jgi:hypothetical protein
MPSYLKRDPLTRACLQGFPEHESDCKREKEKLKKEVLAAKKELLEGEHDMPGDIFPKVSSIVIFYRKNNRLLTFEDF